MSAKLIFYQQNSQFLQVSGLKDQSQTPATYVNDAVLTGNMVDATGASVIGCQNIQGVYQASSNGTYRFLVDPQTFNPPVGSTYTLVVDGASQTRRYHVEFAVKVVKRSTGIET